MKKLLYTLIALLLLVSYSSAQTVDELLKPVTRTYVLKDVNIVQKPGQVIEKGTVVIKDGLIQAVGKNVQVPAGAEELKAEDMYVYAGFIDALSHIGIPAPSNANTQQRQGRGGGRPQGVNRGNPPRTLAGITPEVKAEDKLSVKDKEIAAIRKHGFTTVHSVPRGRMLPGKGAIIVLGGENAQDMVVKKGVSLFSQLSTARGVYPGTIMGVMTKYRELYGQAKQLMAHHEAFDKKQQGLNRPESDPCLEAFFPVIEGNQAVFFTAPGVLDIHRVMALQKDLGFNLVLANVKQGWHWADKIKASNTPIILSTDLPKEIKEKKKEEAKKEGADKKEDKKDPETEALEKRKMEAYKKHVGQAATMAEAGIPFGFSTASTKSKDVRKNINRMVKSGLSADQALSALTTTPAEMLGVSSIMGTVEQGKMANLVISDKPYFEEKSNVRFVIADGHVFRYEAPKAKKPSAAGANAKRAKVGGAWSFEIEIPGQQTDGTLTLSDDGETVSGTIKTSQTPEESDIKEAELNGNELFFTTSVDAGGQALTLEFTLTFDGNSFEGKVDVGQFGSFDISGTKNP